MARTELFVNSLHVPIRRAEAGARTGNLQFHYAVSQILLKGSLSLEAQLQEVLRLIGGQFQLNEATIRLIDRLHGTERDVVTWQLPPEPGMMPIVPPTMVSIPLSGAQGQFGLLQVLRDLPLSRPEEATLQVLSRQLSGYICEQERIRVTAHLAQTDGLTNVANHRAMQEHLAAVLPGAKGPISLVMVDIDHFKQINDQHGHQLGDRVLTHVAALLQGSMRQNDLVARYGGEEFALVLANTKAEGALVLAERLRDLIESSPYVDGERLLKVTVSLGVATRDPAMELDGVALLRQADAALYTAKHRGRNCAVAYDASQTYPGTETTTPLQTGAGWLAASAEMVLATWDDLARQRDWPLPDGTMTNEVLPSVLAGLIERLGAGADDGGVTVDEPALSVSADQVLRDLERLSLSPLHGILALRLLDEVLGGLVDGVALSPIGTGTLRQRLNGLLHGLEVQVLLQAMT